MIKRKLIILVIVVFLAVIGYINFFPKKITDFDPKNIPAIIISPTINTPTEMVADIPISKGTVMGKICFPSSFVPEGYILAKNVNTNVIEKIYFEGVPPLTQEYSLSLNEGKYVFAYAQKEGEAEGFYSSCALITNASDCGTPKSHELIEIDIRANDTVSNIDLCDYYYSPEEKPVF